MPTVMLEARIQNHFFESADLAYQVAEQLAHPIAEAAQVIAGCLTAGGRLLVHAHASEAQRATWLVERLLAGQERERPPLAALALSGTSADLAARQLQTHGQAGDLLLLLCPLDDDDTARALIAQAHQQELGVLMFSGGMGAQWPSVLRDTDVWVPVPHERHLRIHEIHLIALHALCDAIDLQLLGEADPA